MGRRRAVSDVSLTDSEESRSEERRPASTRDEPMSRPTKEPEVNVVYHGFVDRKMTYGVFVKVDGMGGRSCLVPTSKLQGAVEERDMVYLKVVEVRNNHKCNGDMRYVDQDTGKDLDPEHKHSTEKLAFFGAENARRRDRQRSRSRDRNHRRRSESPVARQRDDDIVHRRKSEMGKRREGVYEDVIPRRREDYVPRRRDNDDSQNRRRDDDVVPRRRDDDVIGRRRQVNDIVPRRRDDDIVHRRRDDDIVPRRREEDVVVQRRRDQDVVPRRRDDGVESRRRDDDIIPRRR